MKFTALCVPLLLLPASPAFPEQPAHHSLKLLKRGQPIIVDDFSCPTKTGRRLERGTWVIRDGQAVSTQDDELFKKYDSHGPAIWYDQQFADAIIEFEFRVSPQTKMAIFTINGTDGHVFRFRMQETGTDIRAWGPGQTPKLVANSSLVLPKNTWLPVTVEVAGRKAAVNIGGSYSSVVEDPSYSVAKTVVGVTFHYGTLAIRNFRVTQGRL